jgi:hypothetical protein
MSIKKTVRCDSKEYHLHPSQRDVPVDVARKEKWIAIEIQKGALEPGVVLVIAVYTGSEFDEDDEHNHAYLHACCAAHAAEIISNYLLQNGIPHETTAPAAPTRLVTG